MSSSSDSFTGGQTKPCAGCPWRKDNAHRSEPCEGKHAEMRDSGAFSGEDGMFKVMSCHMIGDGRQAACVGYLLSDHAYNNLHVRFARAGVLGLSWTELDAEGIETYDTYDEMIEGSVEVWGEESIK